MLERHCEDADRDPATITAIGERRHRVAATRTSRRSSARSPSSCGRACSPAARSEMVDRVGAYRDAGAEMADPRDARAVRRRRPRPLRRRGAPAARVTDELRLDPLTREWVAIVADRQDRPNLAPIAETGRAGCPFCVGGLEAPEPYTVRAFENRWPPFVPGDADRLRRRARRRLRLRLAAAAGRGRGRPLLPRPRRARSRRSASTARAGSSTSGRSAPRRCSRDRRSSTCSCSRTGARSSARRSRTRTGRSTRSRSCRRSRGARPRSRPSTAARCAPRSATRSATARESCATTAAG